MSYSKVNVLPTKVKKWKISFLKVWRKYEIISAEFNWQHLPLQTKEYTTVILLQLVNKAVNQKG